MTGIPKRYLDDFAEGETQRSGAYVVTEAEILAFAREFDPQPFHLDPVAAEVSMLGGLAASGWHTTAMGMRLIYDEVLADAASLGSPGVDEVRWLAPVRPGDRLTLSSRVTNVRPSRSKPDRGIVTFAFALFNQDEVCVMTQTNSIMIGRRPQGTPA